MIKPCKKILKLSGFSTCDQPIGYQYVDLKSLVYVSVFILKIPTFIKSYCCLSNKLHGETWVAARGSFFEWLLLLSGKYISAWRQLLDITEIYAKDMK